MRAEFPLRLRAVITKTNPNSEVKGIIPIRSAWSVFRGSGGHASLHLAS